MLSDQDLHCFLLNSFILDQETKIRWHGCAQLIWRHTFDKRHVFGVKCLSCFYTKIILFTFSKNYMLLGKCCVVLYHMDFVMLQGVPGNGSFTSKDQLYLVLTSIIYTCSVAHASTNFPQYDEYAFPPNYPALLTGKPPTDKVNT
jgi:hypothetical protein